MAAADLLTFNRNWAWRGYGSSLNGASEARCTENLTLQSDLYLISQAWVWHQRNSQSTTRRPRPRCFLSYVTSRKSARPPFPASPAQAPVLAEPIDLTETDALVQLKVTQWLCHQPSPLATSQRRDSGFGDDLLHDPSRNAEIDFNSEEGLVSHAKGKKKRTTVSNNYSARNGKDENNTDNRENGDGGGDQGNGDARNRGGAGNGGDDGDQDKDKDGDKESPFDASAASASKKKKNKKGIYEFEPESLPDAAPDPPDVFDDVKLGDESAGKPEPGFGSNDGKSSFGAWGQMWNTGWGRSGSSSGNLHGTGVAEKKNIVEANYLESTESRPKKQDFLDLSLDDANEEKVTSASFQKQFSFGEHANGDASVWSAGVKKGKKEVETAPIVTQPPLALDDWTAPTLSTKDKKKKKGALSEAPIEDIKSDAKKREADAWETWDTSKRKEKKKLAEDIAPSLPLGPDSELVENAWTSGITKEKKKREQAAVVEEPEFSQHSKFEWAPPKEEEDPWGFQSKPSKKDKKKKKSSTMDDVISEPLLETDPGSIPYPIVDPPTENMQKAEHEVEEDEEEEEEESGGLWATLSGKKEKKKKKVDGVLPETAARHSTDGVWDSSGGANKIDLQPPPAEKDEGWSFWSPFGGRKKKTESPVLPQIEIPKLEKPEPESPLTEPILESEKGSKGVYREETKEETKTRLKKEAKSDTLPEDSLDPLGKKEKKKKKSSTDTSKEESRSSKSKKSSTLDAWEEPTTSIKKDKKKGNVDLLGADELQNPPLKESKTLVLKDTKALGDDDFFSHWNSEQAISKNTGGGQSSWRPDGIEEPNEDPWSMSTKKSSSKTDKSRGEPVEFWGATFGETVQPDDVEEVRDGKVAKADDWAWTISNKKKPEPEKDALADPPPRAPTPPSMDFEAPEDQATGPNKVTGDEASSTKSKSRSKDKESNREKGRSKDEAPKLTEREMKKLEREKRKAEKAEKERLEMEAREAEERVRQEAEEEAARAAEELLVKEAEEQAVREAEERAAREAEEEAAREAEEMAAREAEAKAAEQAAKDAEIAAMIIAEEREIETLKDKRVRRGKLTKRETEKLHRLEENALKRAEEQAAREAEEEAAREAERAAIEEAEKAAKEAEEQAAREAEAAIIAIEEAEMAALIEKRNRKGKLTRRDTEKLNSLERHAMRRAEEQAAREAEQAAEEERAEEEEKEIVAEWPKGVVVQDDEVNQADDEDQELVYQEAEEHLIGQDEEMANQESDKSAAQKAAARAAREADEQAEREFEEALASKKSKRSSKTKETKEKEKKKDKKSRSSKSVPAELVPDPDREPVKELEEPVAEPIAEPEFDLAPEPEATHEHERQLSELNEAEVEELLAPKETVTTNAFSFWGLGSKKKKTAQEVPREVLMDGKSADDISLNPLPSKSPSGIDDEKPNQPENDVEADAARSPSPTPIADNSAKLGSSLEDGQDSKEHRQLEKKQSSEEEPPPEDEPLPRERAPTGEKVDKSASQHDSIGETDRKARKGQLSEKRKASSDKKPKSSDIPEKPPGRTSNDEIVAVVEPPLRKEKDRERERENEKDKEREKEKKSGKKRRATNPTDEIPSQIPIVVEPPLTPPTEPKIRRSRTTHEREALGGKLSPPRKEEKRATRTKTEHDSRPPAALLSEEANRAERPSRSSQPGASLPQNPPISRSMSTRERRASATVKPHRRHSSDVHGLMSPPPLEEIPPMAPKAARIFGVDRLGFRQKPRKPIPQDEDNIMMVGALGNDVAPPPPPPPAAPATAAAAPRDKRRSRRFPDDDVMMLDSQMPENLPKRGMSGSKKGGLSSLFGFMAPKAPKISPPNIDVDATIDRDGLRESRKFRRSEREERDVDDLRHQKEDRDRERRRRRRDESESRKVAENNVRREKRATRQREEEERRAMEEREARKAERHRLRREREREKEKERDREREKDRERERERERERGKERDRERDREKEREREEVQREAKRQRRRSEMELPSGDEGERPRRSEARRAARAAAAPMVYGRQDNRKYPQDNHLFSGQDRRREIQTASAGWPHSGTSSWVKDHSDAPPPPPPPPPDDTEQTDGMGMTEDEARREARRAHRRREKAGDFGTEEERRRMKREAREREAHDRQARDRDGRERTRRTVTSSGSDERYRGRRAPAAAEPTPRSSWWRKITG